MKTDPRPIHILSLIFYGAVSLVAFLIIFLRTGHFLVPLGTAPLLSAAAAALAAAPVIGFSAWSIDRYRWARELAREFAALLGPLRTRDIVYLAALSGLAEELLFRGALLPWIGLTASSLLFGIIHFHRSRRFLPWTAFAVVMGFVLGGCFLWTGDILSPILIHFTVNFFNLSGINKRGLGGEEAVQPVSGPPSP
jgi:membrane protease YdiL (CAAX protease family)